MAVDCVDALEAVVGICMLICTPGSPLPTAIKCRLPAVAVPAIWVSTVKIICEAVTPEFRKAAMPCVMMPCLSDVKGRTDEPKICISTVRVEL